MIEFDDVGHYYDETTAAKRAGTSESGDAAESAPVLAEVTASLPERRVAFVGANGSGKSTLARTINGLVRPSRGRVLVNGLDPAREGRAVRKRVGFLFTNPDSQIVMPTAAEDVAFSLRRRGSSGCLSRAERARLASETLAEHGLGGYEDHPAHQLSGGQKQLLALCSMLVLEPDVLVCDEPTTLLDLRNKRRFVELLGRLEQQIILVTHDLDLLDDFERVLVLDGGRVVADDVPSTALPYYRELAG